MGWTTQRHALLGTLWIPDALLEVLGTIPDKDFAQRYGFPVKVVSVDVSVGATRVIANPAGYGYENDAFTSALSVVLP